MNTTYQQRMNNRRVNHSGFKITDLFEPIKPVQLLEEGLSMQRIVQLLSCRWEATARTSASDWEHFTLSVFHSFLQLLNCPEDELPELRPFHTAMIKLGLPKMMKMRNYNILYRETNLGNWIAGLRGSIHGDWGLVAETVHATERGCADLLVDVLKEFTPRRHPSKLISTDEFGTQIYTYGPA